MAQRRIPPELASPFLDVKVQLPAATGEAIGRPRLLGLLDGGDDTELTVVSGPAGAGKTSLLVDWVSARPARPVGWLSLDEYDNDPTHFWIGVAAALAAVPLPDLDAHAARLAGTARTGGRAFLDALGEALGDGPDRPTLVLDDYHAITEEAIHADVALAVRYLSSRVRLVLATRTTPPLPLGRLRARGRLCEIRFDDLRFTAEEGTELLARMGGDRRLVAAAPQLTAETEGWAAALYVAAMGRRRADAERGPGRRGGPGDGVDPTRRHLSEYLVEEVLAQEPPERQRFLLETSILDPLTASRCDAVTGLADSARLLRELEQSSQFLRRQDDEGRWYRCHALLRELLQVELVLQGRPVAELHRRASVAAEAEHDAVAAVHHAFEGGDLDRAARLIGAHWIDFTNRGRFTTVAAWIDRWRADRDPASPIDDPTILVVGAWTALHRGRMDEVEEWLGEAERIPFDGPLPDGTSSVVAAVSIVRNSHRRRTGAVGQGVEAAEAAVLAETDPGSGWRAVALVGRGVTLYWAGQGDQARASLDDAVTVGRATGLMVPIILGEGHLALLDRREGNGDRARRRAEAAVALAREAHIEGYDQLAAAHLARGLCRLDAIDLDGADEDLTLALGLALQGQERLIAGAAHLGRAELAHLRDDGPGAGRALAEAEHIVGSCDDPGLLAELLDAVRRRLAGGTDPIVPAGPPGAGLTRREHTVLRYLGSDLTLPAIARELHVSPNTIKTQVASIRTKLGASSRAEAVRVGRERGLLP